MRALSSQTLLKIASAPAVLGLALLSTAAYAQEPQSAEGADEGDTIIVTGSRISRPELEVANPIVAITSEAIEATGQINVSDILIRNPALSASIGSASSGYADAGLGEVGANLLDLRNLGVDRTLVLVNGKRHVAGVANSAAVDINTIPQELIEKVDVLTGGASAVYGADGVSGVVNFILKRDYEGFAARAQAGVSSKGDAGSQRLAFTAGKNFFDGRANLTASYEYNKSARLHSSERLFSGSSADRYSMVRNPDDYVDDIDDPSVYDYIKQNNLTWAWSAPQGVVDLADATYLGNGEEYDWGVFVPYSATAIGGTNTPLAGYFGDLQPETDQHAFNLMGSYEFSPAARFYFEGKYVRSEAYSVAQPSFEFNTLLAADNAYLLERFGSGVVPFALDDEDPDSPFIGAYLSRDNLDLGLRGETNRRETYRFVAGFEGELSEHLRYDISYVYGRTKVRLAQTNYMLTDRFFAALDAVDDGAGNIVCRSTLDPTASLSDPNFLSGISTFTPGAGSACRPLNLLGENVASKEALDFIRADNTTNARIAQEVVSGYISGDTGGFFRLPGGPVGFALGAEYRKEKSEQTPDLYMQNGELRSFSAIAPSKGEFDVKEIFGEVNLPILAGVPFAERLSIGGAVRVSDYSTVGSTTTWKVDGVYAPIRDLRFRASYSQAVRAPNIGELFRPESGGFFTMVDPCQFNRRDLGTEYRAANCQTLLEGFGLTPAEISAFNPGAIAAQNTTRRGTSSGNPGLQEETAKTWTAGVVIQPRFIPGLTLNFDWYNIKIEDAINTPSGSELAELCVDQPTLDNDYCPFVFRNPDAGPLLGMFLGAGSDPAARIGVSVRPENVAAFRTSGADFGINYAFSPSESIGRFAINLTGGYLHSINFVPTVGAAVDDTLKDMYNPKWRGNASIGWSLNNFAINYGVNYHSKTRRFSRENMQIHADLAAPELLWYKALWQHDVRASVSIDKKFELYGGVNNLFDQEPDFGELSYPISGVGRYLYAGVKVGF